MSIGTSIPPFSQNHTVLYYRHCDIWYVSTTYTFAYNTAGTIDVNNTRKVDNDKGILILNVYNRFINNEITLIEYLKLLLDVKY